jgi:type II secretory pathway pseudopilin PulG
MMRFTRRLRGDSTGLGLSELVVTIFILGILSTIVVGLYVNVSRTFNEDSAATDSTNVAALGMNELTRVIRAGTEIPVQGQTLNNPVFVAASNEDVTLYAYIDTGSAAPQPVKVRFYINGSRKLIETRWNSYTINTSYWAFNTTVDTTKTVASFIKTRAAGEKYIFTYYKADGTQLVVPGTGTFTTNELRSIAAVQVTMTVQADLVERANPVTLQNTVGIPNLGISRVGP